MKLSVVIPVYNEKNTLEAILEQVESVDLGDIEKEIVLVDDASTDGSTEILRKLENTGKYKVYYHLVNQGKGAPQDYKKLLRALDEENVEVVYGSRFSGNYKDMTGLHYIGNKTLTILTNLLYGVMLTDMETCYKLLPGDFVRNLKIRSNRFNFEPEITAKILKSKVKIAEVPISYAGRSFEDGKKITWKDGFSALATLIIFRFLD